MLDATLAPLRRAACKVALRSVMRYELIAVLRNAVAIAHCASLRLHYPLGRSLRSLTARHENTNAHATLAKFVVFSRRPEKREDLKSFLRTCRHERPRLRLQITGLTAQSLWARPKDSRHRDE